MLIIVFTAQATTNWWFMAKLLRGEGEGGRALEKHADVMSFMCRLVLLLLVYTAYCCVYRRYSRVIMLEKYYSVD